MRTSRHSQTAPHLGRGPVHARVAGHLGEFLQGRIGPDGPVALVTLPCPVLALRATWRPGPGFALRCLGGTALGSDQARRFLRLLGHRARGTFVLRPSMPLGGGAGASTAALVAMAHLVGVRSSAAIAEACREIEGATDPLMFAHPAEMLWASRAGHAVMALPPPPDFDVVGGFWGAPQRTDATDTAFPDIAPLAADWSAKARAGDRASCAALARASAQATLALRGPEGDPTSGLAQDLGAEGYAIGHTGSARALLFAPGTRPSHAIAALREAGMTQCLAFRSPGR